MKKPKIHSEKSSSKTYILGRACQYCGEPIEDQARATKIHCTRWKDAEGQIHDCKRKKHQLKHQPEEDVLLDFSSKQRTTKQQIEKMIAAHGDIVTTEILNAYNVILSENLGFSYQSGLVTAEFLGYNIVSNPQINNHKILKK
jgi:hypothetical protein